MTYILYETPKGYFWEKKMRASYGKNESDI